jgi:uncharacterized protein YegL
VLTKQCVRHVYVSGVKLCDNPADIAFIIDSSVSILTENFDKQKIFVQELMQTFEIGPDSIQVSAVTFSRDARTEFNFNDVDNTQEAQARV